MLKNNPANANQPDGIHIMVPREKMIPSARKLRDNYARVPGAPFYHRTFGLWMCIDTWYEQGLPRDTNLDEFFLWDPPGFHALGQLGWCEAAFEPGFDEIVVEDRGEHEVVQDFAGRHVLYFKSRRHGFMPEYIDHPVKDMNTWQENVKWRLDPNSPQRVADLEKRMKEAKIAAAQGQMIQQNVVGGYMYLRALIGPEKLFYMVYDAPELIEDCMKTWFELADAVIAEHQKHVTIDELYFGEDITYNHGPLISPEMIKKFLFPYYQQIVNNTKARQKDKSRHLYFQLDTDGDATTIIDLYRDGVGMDVLGPNEVASGCDVVKIGKEHPDLALYGGIDKRILSEDTDTLDRYLESILPVMRKRGGYIPTCDHGVPPEVTWQQYLHYRKRCREFGD